MNNRIAMIMLLAIAMITVPSASAGVTAFSVTPATTTAGTTSAYLMQINTTGFNLLNITIPAGFGAVEPAAGDPVVRVDMWGTGLDDYANVTFTANSTDPTTKVDVCVSVLGDADSPYMYSGLDADYSAGGLTDMGKGACVANLTLPTAGADGTLNISVEGGITTMTVALYLVKNPTTAGTYTFDADGTTSDVTITDTPVVSIGSAECGVGDTVNVPISITDASNIGAMDITVDYDAIILTATGVANGTMMASLPNLVVAHDISAGRVNISFATYPETVNGDGELFVVTFDAAGNSTLDINTEAWTGDVPPQPVAIATEDGYVNVTGEAGLPKNGDMNAADGITFDDVELLAMNYYFGDEEYPVYADPDVDSVDGLTFSDVELLAMNYYFGDGEYPLYPTV